jgi:hypothetical protein
MGDRLERSVLFLLLSCIAAVILLLLRAYVVSLFPEMMFEVRAAGWAFVAAVYIFIAIYCVEA